MRIPHPHKVGGTYQVPADAPASLLAMAADWAQINDETSPRCAEAVIHGATIMLTAELADIIRRAWVVDHATTTAAIEDTLRRWRVAHNIADETAERIAVRGWPPEAVAA